MHDDRQYPDPHENGLHNALSPDEARHVAANLPLDHRFRLESEITRVQHAYLERNGYLVFAQVATADEVERIINEVDRVQTQFLAEGRRKAYGVPLWFGRDEQDNPYLQRTGFLSMYSDYVKQFVTDARFEPIRKLVGASARIGHEEKDGVVFNRYIRTKGSLRPGLAWHTDGLRDAFYGQLPGPMLNVGLHFERIRPEDGGLRIIPGSHTQGWHDFLFRKLYFVDHRPDPAEIMVETWPGDLTVHDGRTWHRVAASQHTGARSRRQSMYVPYVTGPYQPKSEQSATAPYLKFFDFMLRAKSRLGV
ncbi:MAG TPA: phytanoyl-CoA dioxygenase family protein [Polyangium sp.]|nr:phytanoyl-CoA dioxygenase family protein [Polyangium sp.]